LPLMKKTAPEHHNRLLILSIEQRSIAITEAFDAIKTQIDADIVYLTKRQIRFLPWTLAKLGAKRYHQVLVDLPFKRIHKKRRALKKIKRLYVYEEDACQETMPASKWRGKFSNFYQHIAPEKVLVTGSATADNLKKEGIPAFFIPKGYSSHNTGLLNTKRDIDVGFIGRVNNDAYKNRAEILRDAQSELECEIMRTSTPEEYRRTLNRIRFFFSADIGLNEYMAKNFEAMACGCILVAYRQGNNEEASLGLKDMENCILYNNLEEAKQKITEIRSNPERENKLRDESINFSRKFSHWNMGLTISEALKS